MRIKRKSKLYGDYVIVQRTSSARPKERYHYSYNSHIKYAIEDVRAGKGDFVIDLSPREDMTGHIIYKPGVKVFVHYPELFVGRLVDREKGEALRAEILENWRDIQFEEKIYWPDASDCMGRGKPRHIPFYVETNEPEFDYLKEGILRKYPNVEKLIYIKPGREL